MNQNYSEGNYIMNMSPQTSLQEKTYRPKYRDTLGFVFAAEVPPKRAYSFWSSSQPVSN